MSSEAAKKEARAARKFAKTGGKFRQRRLEKKQEKLVASASAATVTNGGGVRPSNIDCAALRMKIKSNRKAIAAQKLAGNSQKGKGPLQGENKTAHK